MTVNTIYRYGELIDKHKLRWQCYVSRLFGKCTNPREEKKRDVGVGRTHYVVNRSV